MGLMRFLPLATVLAFQVVVPVAAAAGVEIPREIRDTETGVSWWRSQETLLGDPEDLALARRFFGSQEDGTCTIGSHPPVCPAPCEDLAARARGARSVVVGAVEEVAEGFAGGSGPSPTALLAVRVLETLLGTPVAEDSTLFVRFPNADFELDGTRFRYVACDQWCRPADGAKVVLFLFEEFFHDSLRLLTPTSEMITFEHPEDGAECASAVPDLDAVIRRVRSLGRNLVGDIR